jgi:5S rRNA maturation endonuclease (ribonuclease M5)
VNCHANAGCSADDIVAALGLTMSDLYDEPKNSTNHSAVRNHTRRINPASIIPHIVATYPYTDEDGELRYEMVRKEPKTFLFRRPDGRGNWIWKKGDTRLVLYHLPEVKKAIANGDTIFIVEGEKDADRLQADGFTATSAPFGAGEWKSQYAELLAGAADVVIVADKDEPGLKHAADVYRSIVGVVDSVKIAQARAGKDASDHLDSGFAVEELEQLEPGELPMADDAPAASKTEDADDHLPDAFWNARPELAHIRQAAYARTRSADVVLHAVFARVAAFSPHTLRIPPIVGSSRPVSYFGALVGPPGAGKSSGASVAGEQIPAPHWDVADNLPPGSGEGLAEVLFDLVSEPDVVTGKMQKVKKQVRHNAFVYIDEGEALGPIGGRQGSTTMSTLRSIWSGETIGQTNASNERKRIVPGGSYNFGVIAALQPHTAGTLLADAAAGTPQRLAWAWAVDPAIPDTAPPWPGLLDWTPLPKIEGQEFAVDPAIAAEVRAHDLAISRGDIEDDTGDAHAVLLRLKVAAILALLAGRVNIDTEDWDLAEMVVSTSKSVRLKVAAIVADVEKRREEKMTNVLARRQVVAAGAVEDDQVERVAKRVVQLVSQAGRNGLATGAITRALSKRQRDVAQEAIDYAEESEWIVRRTSPGQGQEKDRFYVEG